MMTPLQFEALYQDEWAELERMLEDLRAGGRRRTAAVSGERFAALYRRICEHLALARARAYPAYLTERLDQITADAHQVIYQRSEFGWSRIRQLVTRDFPRAVRANSVYVWTATALFAVPTLILGLLVFYRPELILAVVDPATAAGYEQMYSPTAESIGRDRGAHTDWAMFGFYIRHNVGIAFQCFAGGLFFGIGSLFYLAYNGVIGGAIGGFLTQRGLSETFYSFIVTHAAFELTAIVLSGAAGLRIGHSLLAPGHSTRMQSLIAATRDAIVIVYGAAGMLLIAAAIEAFWSSAAWIPPLMKYGVAAVCWAGVLGYLTLQGRRAG